MSSHNVFTFETDIDFERLLLICGNKYDGFEPFKNPYADEIFGWWHMKHVSKGYPQEIAEYFESILETKLHPRFIIQDKGSTLPWHVDHGTTAAINFVLEQGQTDMIHFRDGSAHYETALINVSEEHCVPEVKEDRILFKLSMFDVKFEDIKQKLIKAGY